MRTPASKAFTLIELLVAVAVVGVLATLVVQNFRNSRIKAADANIKSSIRSYGQALELHYAQKKTYFVSASSTSSCTTVAVPADPSRPSYGRDITRKYVLEATSGGASNPSCVGFKGGSMGRIT